ncbi:MAG: putative baseplate assembly protein [Elainella sp. C42_A2020_010]|nr:putative baseplate assembly protein [Elainella sp. C42_A2020_010]
MISRTFKVDPRIAEDISQQLRQLISIYMPEQFPTADKVANQGVQAALIAAAARHAELIIQRLNQVPNKNLLAFLNLLGASQLPPQAARVPLTFFLAQGSSTDAVVPAGTSVATPASNGQAALTFQTEQELIVTATQLTSVLVRDPLSDRFADYSAIAFTSSPDGVPIFAANQPIEHSFYIGSNALFSLPNIQSISLTLQLKDITNFDSKQLQWEVWDGQSGVALQLDQDNVAANDTVLNDTILNDTILNDTIAFRFTTPPAIPLQSIQAFPPNHWLRCRLSRPITPLISQGISAQQLPEIQSMRLQVTAGRSQLPIDAAFSNQTPVDLKQPFFPFGQKPRFGDTLYLACQEGFAFAGSQVSLSFEVADPTALGMVVPPDSQKPQPQLQWEFWNGQTWKVIGTSNRSGAIANSNNFVDNTQAFTKVGTNTVQFILADQPQQLNINGTSNFWIRIRIIAGDYGKEAQYTQDNRANITSFTPASFLPPVINTITVGYTLTTAASSPEQILTYNDFIYQAINPGTPFTPFQPLEDTAQTLYLGFQPPAEQAFPNRPLNLYWSIAETLYGTLPALLSAVKWEYWNGDGWTALTVKDGTQNLSHSGLVEFLVPADFALRQEFGIEQYWLRLVAEATDANTPRLHQLIPNTVYATQSTTIEQEILGSSQGTANQVFRTAQVPVLSGQTVQVRELEQVGNRQAIANSTLLNQNSNQNGNQNNNQNNSRNIIQPAAEVWIEWQEVPDFYGSGVSDRHYTLNHLTGEITFGDGLNGRIPLLGANNVRIQYQTGGGTAGNCLANRVVELKTTVPFIDRVSNLIPAAGGTDAESLDALKDRTPRVVRHGGRAVTIEDYEDLAMLASPAVARVKCLPSRKPTTIDLQPPTVDPGFVSVVIVPQSTDFKPIPSLELIKRVQTYLEANAIPTVNIAVVGPVYIQVSITAEISLQSPDRTREVDLALHQSLTRFLHPLTGGFDGRGWIFGREPHKSDLYALLESIPGVDHIRSLTVTQTPDFPNTEQSSRALIYSGTHTLNLTFNS